MSSSTESLEKESNAIAAKIPTARSVLLFKIIAIKAAANLSKDKFQRWQLKAVVLETLQEV